MAFSLSVFNAQAVSRETDSSSGSALSSFCFLALQMWLLEFLGFLSETPALPRLWLNTLFPEGSALRFCKPFGLLASSTTADFTGPSGQQRSPEARRCLSHVSIVDCGGQSFLKWAFGETCKVSRCMFKAPHSRSPPPCASALFNAFLLPNCFL